MLKADPIAGDPATRVRRSGIHVGLVSGLLCGSQTKIMMSKSDGATYGSLVTDDLKTHFVDICKITNFVGGRAHCCRVSREDAS